MIDEAIGKILGMAMAYLASALGMFVAYVNYRRRIVKAERVMSTTAWVVIALTVLATLGGVWVVTRMAATQTQSVVVETQFAPAAKHHPLPPSRAVDAGAERKPWPWVGVLVPGAIFIFATAVTAGLHRHFSTHGQ
jgi:hypothetical protein